MTDQELRVRVLGGAELAVSGRPLVELASAKAAALLFYLAVTGTGHSRSALAGLLWSDLPEPTARANLRLVLTKLRRVLPDHLDVTRQTVALASGRSSGSTPSRWAASAAVRRRTARSCWRPSGSAAATCSRASAFPVPRCSTSGWPGGAPRSAPTCSRSWTVPSSGPATSGHAATGIEVARRMLELERLHEEAHRALMWFLAMGGQRSAALAQYETCRYLLGEELGVEPSAATVALRDEIAGAGGFTELDLPSPTARGRGDQAPPVGAPTPDLPRPLTTLVGRDKELARLRDLLDDPACRLVTLVGPGGIGKTRLAVEVAASRRGRHRDGSVFVSFVGTSPAHPDEAADLVVADLARALGVSLAVPRDPLELLADHLAGRELLLVLDNLEHLRDAAEVIAELLRRAPGMQVLVTSRRRLGLGVEWLVEVPGLPYPPPGADADAAGYEAVQLFEERARLLRPDFPAAAGADGAGRVCRLVAGMPLAIELAARWVRSASPAAIADRLAGGLELLETTHPTWNRGTAASARSSTGPMQLLTDAETPRPAPVVGAAPRLRPGRRRCRGGRRPAAAGRPGRPVAGRGRRGRPLRTCTSCSGSTPPSAWPPTRRRSRETRRRHAEHYASLLPAPAESLAGGGPSLDAEAENLRAATDWLIRVADPADAGRPPAAGLGAVPAHGLVPGGSGILRRGPGTPGASTRLQQARWHRLLGEAHQQLGEATAARAASGAGAGGAGQPGAGIDGRLAAVLVGRWRAGRCAACGRAARSNVAGTGATRPGNAPPPTS